MKQEIEKRIKAWKRFYASQTTDVDENSSWYDILLKLNLSFEESIALFKRALIECGPFNFAESIYLEQLPYYKEVKQVIAKMSNKDFGNYLGTKFPASYDIDFLGSPKLEKTKESNNLQKVPIMVVTIVCNKQIDFEEDIYVWCDARLPFGRTCKHLIIRYTTEKPKDLLLEKV